MIINLDLLHQGDKIYTTMRRSYFLFSCCTMAVTGGFFVTID